MSLRRLAVSTRRRLRRPENRVDGPQARVDRARRSAGTLRLVRATAPALARRPDLWLTGLGTARSMVARRWWRRPPFLPLPERRWLHFRLITAYGGNGSAPTDPDDLITWLEWCRRFPR